MATTIRVGVLGDHRDALTQDIEEMQALVAIDGVVEDFEHHLFLVRIDGSRWVVADSDCTLSVLDIAVEDVVPLGRRTRYPDPGRPYLGLRVLEIQDKNWQLCVQRPPYWRNYMVLSCQKVWVPQQAAGSMAIPPRDRLGRESTLVSSGTQRGSSRVAQ